MEGWEAKKAEKRVGEVGYSQVTCVTREMKLFTDIFKAYFYGENCTYVCTFYTCVYKQMYFDFWPISYFFFAEKGII